MSKLETEKKRLKKIEDSTKKFPLFLFVRSDETTGGMPNFSAEVLADRLMDDDGPQDIAQYQLLGVRRSEKILVADPLRAPGNRRG